MNSNSNFGVSRTGKHKEAVLKTQGELYPEFVNLKNSFDTSFNNGSFFL